MSSEEPKGGLTLHIKPFWDATGWLGFKLRSQRQWQNRYMRHSNQREGERERTTGGRITVNNSEKQLLCHSPKQSSTTFQMTTVIGAELTHQGAGDETCDTLHNNLSGVQGCRSFTTYNWRLRAAISLFSRAALQKPHYQRVGCHIKNSAHYQVDWGLICSLLSASPLFSSAFFALQTSPLPNSPSKFPKSLPL